MRGLFGAKRPVDSPVTGKFSGAGWPSFTVVVHSLEKATPLVRSWLIESIMSHYDLSKLFSDNMKQSIHRARLVQIFGADLLDFTFGLRVQIGEGAIFSGKSGKSRPRRVGSCLD